MFRIRITDSCGIHKVLGRRFSSWVDTWEWLSARRINPLYTVYIDRKDGENWVSLPSDTDDPRSLDWDKLTGSMISARGRAETEAVINDMTWIPINDGMIDPFDVNPAVEAF